MMVFYNNFGAVDRRHSLPLGSLCLSLEVEQNVKDALNQIELVCPLCGHRFSIRRGKRVQHLSLEQVVQVSHVSKMQLRVS